MNQTYFQGLASDMAGTEEAVFFEATPENIAAFLLQHQTAQMAAVGTVDDRTFLTASMGVITICPDEDYLYEQLLPVYSKAQTCAIPAPPLHTVPETLARAGQCPVPDWNYLRWEGCSDEKYWGILSGEALLKVPVQGKTMAFELQVRAYYNGGGLCLSLADWSGGKPQVWGALTTHTLYSTEKDCAFVNVRDLGQDILPWIEAAGLGRPTGRSCVYNDVEYPEYHFDGAKLRELDGRGYRSYSQVFNMANHARNPRKKSSPER